MSSRMFVFGISGLLLRIPMRGYEEVVKALPQEAEKVTNPHEGL